MSLTPFRKENIDRFGLYRPEYEHDNCGFGLIAQCENKPSRWLVETAMTSLNRLTHRGAVAQDGKTGDGCGLMLTIHHPYFRALATQSGIELGSRFAIGQLFTHWDPAIGRESLRVMDEELKRVGLHVVWTRPVPVDMSACGENASLTKPDMVQLFIEPIPDTEPNIPSPDSEALSWDTDGVFERAMFIARRRAEKRLLQHDPQFYVASLSPRLIVYKGMVLPENLPVFFKDLGDPRFESSMCLYHQRFSTNTMPQWKLAQPFRHLAHNGEINTLQGNNNWTLARGNRFASPYLPDFSELMPIVSTDGSDSMALDNILETLVMGGLDMMMAMRILVPPAWQNDPKMDTHLKAFYEYYSLHMDPWDGPAGLVFTDGRYAMCTMDRNGLRPARYVMTKDGHITIASEVGVYDYAPESIVRKGRLKPGEMIAIDLETGHFLDMEEIDEQLKNRQPYRKWLNQRATYLITQSHHEGSGADPLESAQGTLDTMAKQFLCTREERDQVLVELGRQGQEPVSSMGDDTPIAVLSREVRPLYDYFRQRFAQVTNPPIDPLREGRVMSLWTCFGREPNPFKETADAASRLEIESPILSRSQFNRLMGYNSSAYSSTLIDLNYPLTQPLDEALDRICQEAEIAVRQGRVILVLDDSRITPDTLPIHALLATGTLHAHLNHCNLRCDANLVVKSATIRDSHHVATLIGFGATAVYPYFAYQLLENRALEGHLPGISSAEAAANFRKGVEKGLLKIMSKMGISTINSYRGAQLFEALGIHSDVIGRCFPGTISRIEGATLADLDQDTRILHHRAWTPATPIDQGGVLKYTPNSEAHGFNPDVVMSLQKAVREGSWEAYQDYANHINQRPTLALRDCFDLKPLGPPIPLEEVEPVASIVRRFDSAAMSLGALSPEAHEALAIAMNRLGGHSNSGEGGEDPARYGTYKVSKIKQVASARFGVTPEYLLSAEIIQIKMAQGAKPGEGGQLPGFKVNDMIARLRYTTPGTALISPPPHHDIYSIEDLAQLIFDLKQVNPAALVSVKLVSSPGVGTIAAGVAKTYADCITISGHDGGTGASPFSSVRYAGSPWELGLAEAHQTLRLHKLRHKVRLQTDGGLKTGLDVVKAAILGAESYGFGTAPMVALGCKYLRICHLNNCATGVATQNELLREHHFKGLPERVEHYFRFVAEEIRHILARLGVRSLDEIVGQTQILARKEGETPKQQNLNLIALLTKTTPSTGQSEVCHWATNPPFDQGELAEQMVRDCQRILDQKSGGIFTYPIRNTDRSIGARLSGEIAKRHGNTGMADKPITIRFTGIAGQSFGAWNAGGLQMVLEGDANDYVGKGMTGGKLVLVPDKHPHYNPHMAPIMGNTCLYGATGGKVFAAGRAGERFAVRNSGAIAVVEGVGDHGCEYMTNGVVAVLGDTGCNFGAGMTGGLAYVVDHQNRLPERLNPDLVELIPLDSGAAIHPTQPAIANRHDLLSFQDHFKELVAEHHRETRSPWSQYLLDRWEHTLENTWIVKPKALDVAHLIQRIEHYQVA